MTDVEKKGNSVTVTVGLVNSDRWLQNSETGDLSAPEPDKYEKVIFREENGSRYISAVRSLSAPETATTAQSAATTAATATTAADNTVQTDIASVPDGTSTTAEQ